MCPIIRHEPSNLIEMLIYVPVEVLIFMAEYDVGFMGYGGCSCGKFSALRFVCVCALLWSSEKHSGQCHLKADFLTKQLHTHKHC